MHLSWHKKKSSIAVSTKTALLTWPTLQAASPLSLESQEISAARIRRLPARPSYLDPKIITKPRSKNAFNTWRSFKSFVRIFFDLQTSEFIRYFRFTKGIIWRWGRHCFIRFKTKIILFLPDILLRRHSLEVFRLNPNQQMPLWICARHLGSRLLC